MGKKSRICRRRMRRRMRRRREVEKRSRRKGTKGKDIGKLFKMEDGYDKLKCTDVFSKRYLD